MRFQSEKSVSNSSGVVWTQPNFFFSSVLKKHTFRLPRGHARGRSRIVLHAMHTRSHEFCHFRLLTDLLIEPKEVQAQISFSMRKKIIFARFWTWSILMAWPRSSVKTQHPAFNSLPHQILIKQHFKDL